MKLIMNLIMNYEIVFPWIEVSQKGFICGTKTFFK